MEFNPANNIIKLCIQGMSMEAQGNLEEGSQIFLQAWNEATNDFEQFLAAYYVALSRDDVQEKLQWLTTALQHAIQTKDNTVKSAFTTLYASIANCYEALNDLDNAKKHIDLAMAFKDQVDDKGPFYHGTKADLQTGDLLTAGGISNYKADLTMNHIYFTALIHGAGLAAALAKGDGAERVYIVEPTGPYESDPNVTDKKFPGNLTRSYRSHAPLKIVGEVTDWAKITTEERQKWQDRLAKNNGAIIN